MHLNDLMWCDWYPENGIFFCLFLRDVAWKFMLKLSEYISINSSVNVYMYGFFI